MNRRRFLELCAAAAAATGCRGAKPKARARDAGSGSSSGSTSGSGSGSGSASSPAPFPLAEKTITELQAALTSGALTSREIVDHYLARIEAIDRNGPTLRSVIEENPDARAIADTLDDERRAGRLRGPLHGIPILLKDNIDTADRMTTTAGSLALEGSIAPRDAGLVTRLRDAGAVLLGKTNMSEWANIRSTRSSSGWSARGGQCANPYDVARNPCGSSSGSAVATSASLCAASIGTETDGSIICPASVCGIVGLKPTVGLISRSGIIPISRSQDTAGPMTRTVADAAVLLGVLAAAAPDPRDPATAAAADHVHADYTTFLDNDALRGARIGVARKLVWADARIEAVLTRAMSVMRDAGATFVDDFVLEEKKPLIDDELHVLLVEFKAGLNHYLAGLSPSVQTRTLEQLIAFNEKHRGREMPHFDQEHFIAAQATAGLPDAKYLAALARTQRAARAQGIDAVMDRHRLDAIINPSMGPAWTTDHVNGDHFTGGSTTFPAVAGYPSITVPAAFVHDLPVGLSFSGRAWSEPRLLGIAHAFEQATHARRPPKV